MSQTVALIEALKRELRARGLRYRDVAERIGMSEANVKRQFSTRRFTLQRLESICALMDIGIADLVRNIDESGRFLSELTREQEQELVSDVRLLLVAVCARNHWRFEDIVERYEISMTEGIRYLAKLDRMGIIELLPKNRIKLRLAPDFRWLPRGPIERFFGERVQGEFLRDDFDAEDEFRSFVVGGLSRSSRDILVRRMRALVREFTELQNDDARLPVAEREGVGMIAALRPLEFSPFAALRRAEIKPSPLRKLRDRR